MQPARAIRAFPAPMHPRHGPTLGMDDGVPAAQAVCGDSANIMADVVSSVG